MKIKLFLFVVSTVFCFHLFAGNVSLQQAQKVALNFYYEKYNQFEGQVSYDKISIHWLHSETDGIQYLYYVFQVNLGGFVIVSADDRLNPVLGYSFKNKFVIENQPPNVRWWLWQYADQVKYAWEKQLEQEKDIAGKWAKYLNDDFSQNKSFPDGKEVEPLLTTLWDQGLPYNYYCPIPPTGGHVWAGCMATAIAQISYYWRWPDHGQGHTSYIPALHPEYGVQFADFENTWYRYDEMVDKPQTVNTAIAEYIYHYAVNMRMNFDPDGSAPDSSLLDPDQDSTAYHFKYLPYTWLYRDSMPDEEWKTILVGMLNKACPIFYTADPVNPPGHAFVCDGYQDEDYFHFNMGWSGTDNGYYTIDNIVGYNYNQMISTAYSPDTLQFTFPQYCTGENICSAFEGSITDGSGPLKDYLNNTQVSWLIDPQTETDSVEKIELRFSHFHTHDVGDKLVIYDGSNELAPVLLEIYGDTLPSTITSSGNKVLVKFISDGSITAPGFLLNYYSRFPVLCNSMTEITDSSCRISDGSGRFQYENSKSCKWRIIPDGCDSSLTLSFSYFDTEPDKDVLHIYDLDSQQLLATYSGHYTDPPSPVNVTSGKAFMIFTSNNSITGEGWEVYYGKITGIDQIPAIRDLTVSPNPMRDHVNIEFTITTPGTVRINLVDVLGINVMYKDYNIQKSGSQTIELETNTLLAGIYFLMLEAAGQVEVRKIVKY
jgi:hypothetical protein